MYGGSEKHCKAVIEKMIQLNRKPDIYLKKTGTKGRGVFCRHALKAGEELEVTPAIILNERDNALIEKTILLDYAFMTAELPDTMSKKLGIKNPEQTSCLIMGIASFCNHAAQPNAEIVWEESGGTVYYTLRATRAIPKGTEICTSYGDDWFTERDHIRKEK